MLAAVGVATGWWWLFALLALQLVLGLTRGRRWCLACVFYYEVVQPRIGEGPLEADSKDAYAHVARAFCSAIREGTPPDPSLEEGLQVQAVLDAVYAAAREPTSA